MNDLHSPVDTPPSSRNRLALCLFVTMLGLAGCKSTPVDEASLTRAAQAKLAADNALTSEPIQASVQQGVATLNGSVSNDAARSLAANDVAQVAGVRTVVNNLTVQPAAVAASVTIPPPPPIKPEKVNRHQKPSAIVTPPDRAAVAAPEPPPPAPIERRDNAIADAAPHTPPPPPAPRSITLPADTTIPVRVSQTLDSATTQEGDTFSGVLASDILSDGIVVLPQGTPVSGRVSAVHEAAHFKGSSLLTIELTSIDRRGNHMPVTTDSFSKAGDGRGKNSAEKIGGGAAIGAVLGGIFGGGKGAAIGAAAGGGAGAGAQAITKGQQVQIPAETLVRFHLGSPIIVRISTNSQPQPAGDLSHHD